MSFYYNERLNSSGGRQSRLGTEEALASQSKEGLRKCVDLARRDDEYSLGECVHFYVQHFERDKTPIDVVTPFIALSKTIPFLTA